MADFLVNFSDKWKPDVLLSLLKTPYGTKKTSGRCFRFTWGTLAILEDQLAGGKNINSGDREVISWVGDLAVDRAECFIPTLKGRIEDIIGRSGRDDNRLEKDELFRRLNGAFSILYASDKGVAIITDPLNFTQVFYSKNAEGNVASFSTHPDLAAVLAGQQGYFDTVSIAERMQFQYCTFPNTMYSAVKELAPGSLHYIAPAHQQPDVTQIRYWYPPEEYGEDCDIDGLSQELTSAILSSVKQRCKGATVGVALSGGLDSRLVMAAVPQDQDCVGMTLCDGINREARTARNVASAYRRPWVPLFRSRDYIADSLVEMVQFIGFESDFVHAHLFGLSDLISSRVNTMLTGDLSDTILRAYCAKDYVIKKRLGGLLPGFCEKIEIDYTKSPVKPEGHLTEGITKSMQERRESYLLSNKSCSRSSMAEWLKVYPFRHWIDVALWSAQRRVMPLRLFGSDRRIVELGFQCPVPFKLNDKFFLMASGSIYGPGLSVVNANDGVRPCSGHWSRLLQRGVRKIQDGTGRALVRMGQKTTIQHSWHDYQAYWKESLKLDEIREEYGSNLESFDGSLFKGSGQRLLNDKNTEWRYGFRLLQLAVWKGVIKEYQPHLSR